MDLFRNAGPVKDRIVLLAPVFYTATALLYLSSLSHFWKPEWDSAYYLILAKNLLSGKGFCYAGYPCLKIPFGFPLLISPVIWLSNSSILALNCFMLFFVALAFFAIHRVFSRLFSPAHAVLITLLSSWSSLALLYSGYIMIEFPYLAFSYLSILVIIIYSKSNHPSFATGLLAVFLLLGGFFLRTVGIALIAATFFYLLVYRIHIIKTTRFVVLCVLLLTPVISWLLYTNSIKIDRSEPVWQLPEFITSKDEMKRYRFDDPTSSISGITDVAKRGVHNGVWYAGVSVSTISGIKVSPKKENLSVYPLYILVLIGIVALLFPVGFFRNVSHKMTILDFYFMFYIGILLSWSAREQRYLLPVLPILIHYFLSGIALLVSGFRYINPNLLKRNPNFVLRCILFFSVAYLFAQTIHNAEIIQKQRSLTYYSRHFRDFFAATTWLKQNIPEDTRVVSVLAPIAARYSDRWCISFPRVEDHEQILCYLQQIKSDYLLVNPVYGREERYLLSVISSHPSFFTKVLTSGGAEIYKVNRNRLQSK